jgi:hypothetical protein
MDVDLHYDKAALRREEALDLLRAAIDAAGGRLAFCAQHHVSPQYLSDVLRGNRAPGQSVLTPLGLKKQDVYVVEVDR